MFRTQRQTQSANTQRAHWTRSAVFAGALLLLDLLGNAAGALAQGNPQLSDMNAEALEAYQNLEIDVAKAKLEQAIGTATQSGYVGPELTQLYMTLGVVHVAGASDHDQGFAAFLSALCMQPDVQLDPLLSTPDVQQVFIQAQGEAQGGRCAGGPSVVPAPSNVMPAGGPIESSGPQVEDVECPPGVRCGAPGEDDDRGPGELKHWFVNLQFAIGWGFVQPGMKADSKPTLDEVFDTANVLLEPDANGDGTLQPMEDLNGNGMQDSELRYYFDDTSGWVPDADSFDDFEVSDPNVPGAVLVPRGRTPVSNQCEADGIRTGPPGVMDDDGMPFTELTPSSYCARVAASGFVPNIAFRLNPGYFITDSFALSLPVRFALDSGEGSLSNLLIGLRGELLFSEMESATGVPVSWFFGATVGQIQVKPPPKDPGRAVPWVTSGPIGLHTGVNVRVRFHKHFGLIISPEVDLQLPDLLINLELSVGPEVSF